MKTSTPCLQVMFVICIYLFIFFAGLDAVNRVVFRVKVTTVSFAPFCLGAHYHNPPSERVFHSPFVLSVLMTGN